MLSVPTRVAQPLGDIRVPFQGGRGRAEEFNKSILWRRERYDPQGKCMIRHRVNLTRDRGGTVGEDPAKHAGRRWIGVGCVGAAGSDHAERQGNRDARQPCGKAGGNWPCAMAQRECTWGKPPSLAGTLHADSRSESRLKRQDSQPRSRGRVETPGMPRSAEDSSSELRICETGQSGRKTKVAQNAKSGASRRFETNSRP